MNRFNYIRATDIAGAVRAGAEHGTKFLAGGTNLVDLLKEDVEKPLRLVDVNRLPLRDITDAGGELRLGALVSNADTARDQRVINKYPLLASAILAGASPQLRNAATNGGNLNQRTRCYYFYDVQTPCNKREPGSGCAALAGVNRIHAILGTSSQCIATHPSDMSVAPAVLEARVHVFGPQGDRIIPIANYHRLPGDEPQRDTTLNAGELITAIALPDEDFSANFTYLKIRDRLSYAFALVSVAAAMKINGDTISEARVALGGVSHRPWRLPAAETVLKGAEPSKAAFLAFADVLLAGAKGYGHNDFKITLAKRAIVRALTQAANGTPQSQSDKRIA